MLIQYLCILGILMPIADNPLMYTITTKRDDDRVTVSTAKTGTTFTIHSPFGISNVKVERKDKTWPDVVKLRLHLKGLESFKVTAGKFTLNASASSHDGKVRLWKDGNEDKLLDSTSPYWMEIRSHKDGYYEMVVPKTFFKDNPAAITMSWIDFYRN